MAKRHSHLCDPGAVQRVLNEIEGGDGAFELMACGRQEAQQAMCIVVRSSASRRVYLLADEAPAAAGWRQCSEIIGVAALRPLLHRARTRGASRRAA